MHMLHKDQCLVHTRALLRCGACVKEGTTSHHPTWGQVSTGEGDVKKPLKTEHSPQEVRVWKTLGQVFLPNGSLYFALRSNLIWPNGLIQGNTHTHTDVHRHTHAHAHTEAQPQTNTHTHSETHTQVHTHARKCTGSEAPLGLCCTVPGQRPGQVGYSRKGTRRLDAALSEAEE